MCWNLIWLCKKKKMKQTKKKNWKIEKKNKTEDQECVCVLRFKLMFRSHKFICFRLCTKITLSSYGEVVWICVCPSKNPATNHRSVSVYSSCVCRFVCSYDYCHRDCSKFNILRKESFRRTAIILLLYWILNWFSLRFKY